MANFPFLGVLSDEVVQLIKETMLDPGAQATLNTFRTQLVQKANELRVLNQRTDFIQSKHGQYMSTLNDALGDTSNYSAVTIQQNAQVQQKKIIKELFMLIHKILDYLSQGKTETREYVFDYNTDDQKDKGEFIHRKISAQELYASEALTITPGGIVIPRSKLAALFGSLSSVEHQIGQYDIISTNNDTAYQEIAKAAIQAMADLFHQLDAEYKERGIKASKKHLGEKEWERYKYYRSMANWDSEAQKVYERYMLNSQYGNLQQAAYNRGHIAEAYERYLQQSGTDWAKIFEESTGNLPWYAGGDVGSTQVKSLFTSTTVRRKGESDQSYARRAGKSGNPSVRIASMDSILGLTNELLILLHARAPSDNDIKQRVIKMVSQDLEKYNVDQKLQEVENRLAERRIAELFKTVQTK